MEKKSIKNKKGEKFGFGIFIVVFAISVSLLAFVSEGNNMTGFATLNDNQIDAVSSSIRLEEFKNIESAGSLAPGNYYVDENGIVYWTDDSPEIPMAKVNSLNENQKNREIYVDGPGRVGYVLGMALPNENS